MNQTFSFTLYTSDFIFPAHVGSSVSQHQNTSHVLKLYCFEHFLETMIKNRKHGSTTQSQQAEAAEQLSDTLHKFSSMHGCTLAKQTVFADPVCLTPSKPLLLWSRRTSSLSETLPSIANSFFSFTWLAATRLSSLKVMILHLFREHLLSTTDKK